MLNMPYKYSAYLFKDGDETYWVAKAAEFPGVSGVGDTRDEAFRDLDEALELAIEHMQEMGHEAPDAYVYDPDAGLSYSVDMHWVATTVERSVEHIMRSHTEEMRRIIEGSKFFAVPFPTPATWEIRSPELLQNE